MAQRPHLRTFQSIGKIAQNMYGTGGFDGIHTVTYEFTDTGTGETLFRRTMSLRTPHGGSDKSRDPSCVRARHDRVVPRAVAEHLPSR